MTGNASAVRRLQEPKTTQKMGQVKEQGGGGEGHACSQTAHLACHACVRTSTFDAVISCHTLYIDQ